MRRVKVSVSTAGYDLVRLPHPAAQFCTRESSMNLSRILTGIRDGYITGKQLQSPTWPAASAAPRTIGFDDSTTIDEIATNLSLGIVG